MTKIKEKGSLMQIL